LSLFLFFNAISRAAASGAGIGPITCWRLMSTMRISNGVRWLTNDVLNILNGKHTEVIRGDILEVLDPKHHSRLAKAVPLLLWEQFKVISDRLRTVEVVFKAHPKKMLKFKCLYIFKI
jgi:hypothetical protein